MLRIKLIESKKSLIGNDYLLLIARAKPSVAEKIMPAFHILAWWLKPSLYRPELSPLNRGLLRMSVEIIKAEAGIANAAIASKSMFKLL